MTQPAAPAQSDRRIVTIMFADISGFTAMSERMDAEQVTGIMNECFERLGAIIRRYDGTIDKFIGDCVMVLFGAPVAMEDAPKRALNAAIEMREELERYTQGGKLASPLSLHIGVNTGEVIYGAVGSKEQRRETVMGDAVNLAARLEDASTAGQVLVGPETYRRTAGQFEFLSVGPLQLKGKAEKVTVYELRTRKPSVGRARAESGREISSAMVGRERELDRLELQVLKALNGEGSIVHVIGEAGIGKSRLMAEVRERVACKRVTLLEGRAQSTAQNLGYHMFDDLLRHWCGIAENDAPAESMRKLERLLVDLVGGEAEEILPLVALLTGMKLSGSRQDRVNGIEPQSLPELVASRFRQLLTAAAKRSAVVLVLEDLHWADRSSIELLESIFRLVETNPVMVVTVSRPGYEDTSRRIHGFTLGKLLARRIELHLEALTEAECTTLLHGLTKMSDFPQALRDQIHARAGGNPFFVEEIVKALLSSGSLEFKDGTLRPTEKVGAIHIPSTVNEVIMSRFDRLEEELKELLRVAAVIGRSFFRIVLEQLTDPSLELEQKMEQLKGLQMVRERKRQEEVEYIFTHAIMQETIYTSILLQRRKELHARVARAIEERFDDRLQEFYGMLSYHWGQTGEEAKLEQYLGLAGEQALRSAASAEATVYLTQALDLYHRGKGAAVDPKRAAQLEKGIGMSHAARGGWEDAIKYFNSALSYMGARPGEVGIQGKLRALAGLFSLIRTLYLPLRSGRQGASEEDQFTIDIEYRKVRMFVMVGAGAMAIAAASLVGMLSRFTPESIPSAARCHCEISGYLASIGFFRMSARLLEYAAARMDLSNPRDRYTLDYYRLHLAVYGGCRPVSYNRGSRVEMVKVGDYFTYQLFLHASGYHEISFGNFDYAASLLQEAIALAEDTSHKQVRAIAVSISMLLALKKRLYTDTVRDYHRFESWLVGATSDYQISTQRALLAQAEMAMGDVDQAVARLEKDRALISQSGYVLPVFRAEFDYASFLLAVRLLEKGLVHGDSISVRASLQRCRRYGRRSTSTARMWSPIRVQTLRNMGTWLWLMKRHRQAFRCWGRSIDEAERLGYRLELSRTFFEIGCRLRSTQPGHTIMRGLGSDGYLAKAETLFREIGLEKDLELLRDFRAQSA